MRPGSRSLLCAFMMTGGLIASFALSQTSEPEGHVTAIFNEVQILPDKADARPAVINDKVDNDTALRTGDASRSELTFADLTITRLGANTIFSFNKAGRSVRLDSGAILLYVRKNSGGAEISTKAVSVAITGTTLIFEAKPDSYDRMIVLEGDARFSLNNFPDQATEVRAGQLLNVRAGSKKLPKPERADLRRIMTTHPLVKNFPPLPSLDLILAVADGRNPNNPPPPPPLAGAGPQGGSTPVYVPNPTGPFPPPPLPSRYWRCINGEAVQMTRADCEKGNSQCYASEREARSHCGEGGGGPWWCCIDGRVVQISEAQARMRGNQCYRSREEALAHCGKLCWVCIDGKVAQVPEAKARARGAQCYGSEEEARAHCKEGKGKTCWCCVNGQVVQTNEADCQEREGQCYGSRKEARRNCRGLGQTSTPTPTPHRPHPTHPTPGATPKPTPRPTAGRPDYPNQQPPKQTSPKKRFPPMRHATPTPRPGQIIR